MEAAAVSRRPCAHKSIGIEKPTTRISPMSIEPRSSVPVNSPLIVSHVHSRPMQDAGCSPSGTGIIDRQWSGCG